MKKYELILNQRKKVLLGIIDVLILQWVKENPMGGQEIINKIHGQFDVKIGAGTMYPILFSLKRRNLAYTRNDKKRKLYFLTNKGKIACKAFIEDYSKIKNDLELFLEQKKENGIRKMFNNLLRK